MVNIAVKPCTVCGTSANAVFLFGKENDGRREGAIALYRCGSCNTVYLGQYSDSYDEGLYFYYQRHLGKRKDELFSPLTQVSYSRVLQLLLVHGGGRSILDVGCGKGDFVDAALGQGFQITGIDLSQSAVDVAQGFGLPVTRTDFFSEEIQESSQDVVTMFEVIEHLSAPGAFLRRAEAVVKPGGLVYLTTPNYNSVDRRILGHKWKAINREHLTYFTTTTLLRAIQGATSLDVVHLETRNVSTELIREIWGLAGRIRPGKRRDHGGEESGLSQAMDIRAEIESSRWLSQLKRTANSLLNAGSLGSTIVLLLRRPAA